MSAVPGEDNPRNRNLRLDFATGLFGRVEGAIEDANVIPAEVAFPVRSIRREHRANFVEIFGIDRLAVEIALAKLSAHGLDLFQFRRFLALVQHGIHLPHIGLVIHHAAIDFDPGMSPEGHLLGAKNHL
jgi:hypothetical protein